MGKITREEAMPRDKIGYDWLCLAVIVSCDKSRLLCKSK